MGWRDRDWAKFTDEELAALLGGRSRGAPLPPSAEGSAPKPPTAADSTRRPPPSATAGRPRGVSRRRQRIGESILAAFGVLAVVSVLALAYEHLHQPNAADASRLQSVPPLVTPPSPQITTTTVDLLPPSNVIAVRWRASDLAPATQAGLVCVRDTRYGRICASYVTGEKPADALARQIEVKGLRVESAGSG